MIRFGDLIAESVVDGLGVRSVAFLQGCTLACPGCHNPSLQPVDGGTKVSEEHFVRDILDTITPLHRGVTFSGGEPLLQSESLFSVISLIKQTRPDLDIWVYTGYLFEEVRHLQAISLVDVLVDGPFIASERDFSCPFRGSKNQRIIDVPRSLELGRVVEVDLEQPTV